MKKYNINKQFGIYRFLKPPFCKVAFFVSKILNTISYWNLKGDNLVSIEKIKIKEDQLNLLLFRPLIKNPKKTLLYIHGGAFVFKGHKKHFNLCKRYAYEGECNVIFIDYRLAPKYPYPIPLQDCFSTYKWILKNKKDQEIIIGGDSAGALLAIDLMIEIIKNELMKPSALMLIYPLVDPTMSSNSMNEFTSTPMWNSKLNRKMWRLYVKNQSYISPLEKKEISKFPKTYIETAEFDCLHDEGIILAQKLRQQNIPCIINETSKTMHAFDNKNCPITEHAIKERINFLNNYD